MILTAAQEKDHYLFVVKNQFMDFDALPSHYKSDPDLALEYILNGGEYRELKPYFYDSDLLLKVCVFCKHYGSRSISNVDRKLIYEELILKQKKAFSRFDPRDR